jgi:SOS response regulatory protein OraA/RecX
MMPQRYSPAEQQSYLLFLLATREYSRAQLTNKLIRRGCTRGQAEELIQNISDKGLYQESSYTRARARGLIQKNYSQRGLAARLRQERVSVTSGEVDTFFEELSCDDDEVADRLLRKILPPTSDLASIRKDKKVFGRLQRRFAARGLTAHQLIAALGRSEVK